MTAWGLFPTPISSAAMIDEPFFRRPEETTAAWCARLEAMDPVRLSCHLRQRHRIWLDMARAAFRKEKRRRPGRLSSRD